MALNHKTREFNISLIKSNAEEFKSWGKKEISDSKIDYHSTQQNANFNDGSELNTENENILKGEREDIIKEIADRKTQRTNARDSISKFITHIKNTLKNNDYTLSSEYKPIRTEKEEPLSYIANINIINDMKTKKT